MNILTKQDYDLLQSKTFNWLRFPLIFFILFIHTISLYECSNNIVVINIGYLFKEIIARLGVPFFFIVSGYYFFYSKNTEECLTRNSYFAKLKKRIRTLLVPYLFWNLLCALYYLLVPYIGLADKSIFSVNDFLSALVVQKDYAPADYPLWYLRDLIVLCVLSPLIYVIIKYLRVFSLWLFSLPFIFNLNVGLGDNYLIQQSILFFPVGAYFAIRGKNIIYYSRKFKFAPLLYIIFIVLDIIYRNIYINRMGILIGLVTLFNVVSYLMEENKLKENKFLSNASFFLYAFHGLPIFILSRRMSAIFPHTDWAYVLIFFSSVIIVAWLGLGLYSFLKRFFPRFTSVITGGR
ncbi:MAG: acyltransferase [Bacteroidales bacterium]|nr:acyltransferase [Bacteroidales bacterium]